MITIVISKCHCELIREAIEEALPAAQAAGLAVQPVTDLLNSLQLTCPDSVRIEFTDDTWQAVLGVLRHHPQPAIGEFFIHHLDDLAADARLGYLN
jgi:hypothetical protein